MKPVVSVIILAYNKAGHTARCLGALPATRWRPLEVVFVDNGSTDDTPRVVDAFEAKAASSEITVRRLRNEKNAGAATGRNQGLGIASGAFIAFMDNDVVVRTVDWVDWLVRALKTNGRGLRGRSSSTPCHHTSSNVLGERYPGRDGSSSAAGASRERPPSSTGQAKSSASSAPVG